MLCELFAIVFYIVEVQEPLVTENLIPPGLQAILTITVGVPILLSVALIHPKHQLWLSIHNLLQTSHSIGLTMNPSPDAVVTLTSAALLGSVSLRAHDIRSTRHSSKLGIDNQTWGALDALAALCVCEPSSDVIAIGCRY